MSNSSNGGRNGAYEIMAADIGGTHARFAIATIEDGGPISLAHLKTLEVASYPGLEAAVQAYGKAIARRLPRLVAMALACPIVGDTLKMTNNPWVIRLSVIREMLGLENLLVVNDFAAIGHAVARAGASHFERLIGPDQPLPTAGIISIIGPGTGLGVSQVFRHETKAFIIPTEGGHIDFAPLDPAEDAILTALRKIYGRISIERILSGPGLFNLYRALGEMQDISVQSLDPRDLWTMAINGRDPLAVEALQRFCLTLGSVCGDLALLQGASAVVLAGGLLPRIAHLLPQSGFERRFLAKGRFEEHMSKLPVFRILHPEPGLFGAAAAYAAMT